MRTEADGNERRVERILSRVRTEAGLRDVLAFGLSRFWLVLLELFAIAYKTFNRPAAGIERAPTAEGVNARAPHDTEGDRYGKC